MSREAKLTEALKHIAIYYHFISEKMEQGDTVPRYGPPEEDLAHILTKEIGGLALKRLSMLIEINLGSCNTI